MPATVRISEYARNLLVQLAHDEKTTMTDVLDIALESYRRRRFLEQACADYARLATDPAAEADYRSETASLETVTGDGLDSYSP